MFRTLTLLTAGAVAATLALATPSEANADNPLSQRTITANSSTQLIPTAVTHDEGVFQLAARRYYYRGGYGYRPNYGYRGYYYRPNYNGYSYRAPYYNTYRNPYGTYYRGYYGPRYGYRGGSVQVGPLWLNWR